MNDQLISLSDESLDQVTGGAPLVTINVTGAVKGLFGAFASVGEAVYGFGGAVVKAGEKVVGAAVGAVSNVIEIK